MPTEKEILQTELGVDVTRAIADLNKLNAKGKRSFQSLNRVAQVFGKGVQKFVRDPMSRVSKALKDVTKQYKEYGKTADKYNTLIARAHKKMATANKDERDDLKEKIAGYKKLRAESLKELKGRRGGGLAGAVAGAKANIRPGAAAANVGIGGVITSALGAGGALLRKDLEGAIEAAIETISGPFKVGAHLLDKTIGKVFKKTGSLFWKSGDKSFKKAKQMWNKGGAGGVAGAAGMAALGGAGKLLGGLGGALAGMTKALTVVASSMSGIASVAGLVVKLFMQMEEQAKGFNKEVLQVAGTSQFLYDSGMDSHKAFKKLDSTLKDMRDDAFDVGANLQWGITAQDHKAFEQTLFQEGVDLRAMQKEFDAAKKSATSMTGEVQGWGDAVHVAVAFSRNWGVSLQEITQFQGEAVREMGQSFDSTALSMAKMSKDSAGSGIAANKFFAIIRGVSADLNLYNTRLDQASHLLKLMGKYMNPREAQKYMSTMVGMYKQMGEEDRIRQVYLMGVDKAQKIVMDDLKDKTQSLGMEIAKKTDVSAEQFGQAMATAAKDGGKALQAIMDKAGDNITSAQREAIVQLQMDWKRAQKGGAVGLAEAMQNLSAAGAVTATKAALQRFGGGKKLSDMVGLQAFAARKAAGISQDQFDQAVKLEKAIDEQRDAIQKALEHPEDPKNGDLLKRLDKLGVTTKDVSKLSDQQIVAAMDEGQQSALSGMQAEENYAKEQTKLTQTLSDKVGVIIDGVFNYVYDALKNVVDILDEFFDFLARSSVFGSEASTEKADRRSFIRFLQGSNDKLSKDLVGALREGTVGDSVANAMSKSFGNEKPGDFVDALNSVTSTMTGDQQSEAAKKLNLPPAMKNILNTLMGQGKGLGSALGTMGFSKDEKVDLFKQLFSGMSDTNIAKAASRMNMLKGGLGGPSMSEAAEAKVSAQQQSSVNSGGPTSPDLPSAPTAPTSATPTTVAPSMAPAATTTASTPATSDQGEDIISGLDGLQNTLWQKGIKINKSFLRDQFWKNGHDAVLDANREALFEYFLYSKMDAADVAAKLADKKSSISSTSFGSQFVKKVMETGSVPANLDGFASGGIVPRPKSPDQVFVAARPGEKVLPAGAGAGGVTIPIHVTAGPGAQELGNMMKAAALHVVAEWNRKQKFT